MNTINTRPLANAADGYGQNGNDSPSSVAVNKSASLIPGFAPTPDATLQSLADAAGRNGSATDSANTQTRNVGANVSNAFGMTGAKPGPKVPPKI